MSARNWRSKAAHARSVFAGVLDQLVPGRKLERRIHRYLKRGRVPWTEGYTDYRARFIERVLADSKMLDVFRRGQALPENYGVGLDERCIEYPWIMSRIPLGPGTYLDAGSALNHSHVLMHTLLSNKKLHIVTLTPESRCFWTEGVSYLYEDIRSLPMRDNHYDCVISVSTLEHVGFDNALFGTPDSPSKNRAAEFLVAFREVWRVLKPGGAAFITLPFGKRKDFGSFQQFDAALLARLQASMGAAEIERGFYLYGMGGWQVAAEDECGEAEYFPLCMTPRDQREMQAAAAPDLAAAARAVVCLRILKPL